VQVLDALHAGAAALLWIVVLLRARLVRQRGVSRQLWMALAALAAGQTLQVRAIYLAVDTAAESPGTAAVIKHLFAVLAAANVRALSEDLRVGGARRGRRIALTALSVAAMVLPFVLAPPDSIPSALANRAEYYDSTWRSVVHWAGFVGYLAWALHGGTVVSRQFAREAPAGALRTGLLTICWGTSVGFGYVASKVVVVVAWVVGFGPATVTADAAAEAVVLSASIGLIALGSAVPALADAGEALATRARTLRSLRRLEPLWRELYAVAPHIALLPPAGWAVRPVAQGDLVILLVRRVVEIRDGLLALSGCVDSGTRRSAHAAVRRSGFRDLDADALTEAVVLALALEAHRRGKWADQPSSPVFGGRDLAEEVLWLEAVARYRRSPCTRRIADSVAAAIRGSSGRTEVQR